MEETSITLACMLVIWIAMTENDYWNKLICTVSFHSIGWDQWRNGFSVNHILLNFSNVKASKISITINDGKEIAI